MTSPAASPPTASINALKVVLASVPDVNAFITNDNGLDRMVRMIFPKSQSLVILHHLLPSNPNNSRIVLLVIFPSSFFLIDDMVSDCNFFNVDFT